MRARTIRFAGVLGAAVAVSVPGRAAEATYPDRWVYVSRNLTRPEHVDEVRTIVDTAAAHGLNAMLLTAGIEGIGNWDAPRRARLQEVRRLCAEKAIEIVPLLWSVGYGSGQGADPNLAAGLPYVDVPFAAMEGSATHVPDPRVAIVNGGFEQFDGDTMAGYQFHDQPGIVSFADTEIHRGGRAALRFENFDANPHRHGRVMQEIDVTPRRQYRLNLWIKTENLDPPSAFKIQVYAANTCITPMQFDIPATTDWFPLELTFNSLGHDKIRIYAGTWGARTGRFWLDDLTLTETALIGVLRRPGTPLTVTADDGSRVYEEGRDFLPIGDARPNVRRTGQTPAPIRLAPDTRIRAGERLRVSYFHGQAVNRSQISTCMSEPALYDYWRATAAAVKQHLDPARWFLSMDEIRAGGSCAACKARNLSMAEILGDCITRQVDIIRTVRPDARIYIWSDMLDPNHNAHDNYYLVDGDFTGSWNHIPTDLVIACWYFGKRDDSMKFFSERGFATLAGAYYDGDDLSNIRGWLETANNTPLCRGIMYTTWRNKYELLPAFGAAVRQDSAPIPAAATRPLNSTRAGPQP